MAQNKTPIKSKGKQALKVIHSPKITRLKPKKKSPEKTPLKAADERDWWLARIFNLMQQTEVLQKEKELLKEERELLRHRPPGI